MNLLKGMVKCVRLEKLAPGLAVFLGAALLFQIQPIVARLLLPGFGGSAVVWALCVLYFQGLLVAGYAYAHLVTTKLRPRRQVAMHSVLVLVSLASLPIALTPEDLLFHQSPQTVIVTLTSLVGLNVFVLSCATSLIQRWLSYMSPLRTRYRLYSVSNLGALAALLSYPWIVAPVFSLRSQLLAWCGVYVGFVALVLLIAYRLWLADPRQAKLSQTMALDSWPHSRSVLTIVLSAAGVIVLLAVTNQITQNLPPAPFLWLLPLSIYLLTYIICFGANNLGRPGPYRLLFFVALPVSPLVFFFGTHFDMFSVVALHLVVLFVSCMVCHGELYRLRPSSTHLTRFYLFISIGGAIGGAFVSLLAPSVFDRFWEYPMGIYVIYVALGVGLFVRLGASTRRPDDTFRSRPLRTREPAMASLWLVGCMVYPLIYLYLDERLVQADIYRSRNSYGVLAVIETDSQGKRSRALVDGTTIHGTQVLNRNSRNIPAGYYRSSTGLAAVMNQGRDKPRRDVGIVGLGTGAIAAYGRPNDRFRFYELNPAVVEVAHGYFYFLRDSAASIEIVDGDARVSMTDELAQNGSQNYDILIIDAFSSNAVPMHLLTREAFRVYWSHIKSGGVLAIHISNNYVNLAGPIANLAAEMGRTAQLIHTEASDRDGEWGTQWVIIADQAADVAHLQQPGSSAWTLSTSLDDIWTDDYSDLLDVLK